MSDELGKSLQHSVNQKFGHGTYQVLEPIKRGADGYVYKIQFLKHKKLGALKVLPKSLLSIQPDAAEELKKKYKHDTNLQRKAKNQIKIHSALNSGFIVKLQNWSKDDMNYYLVLQYIAKGDLGDQILKNTDGLQIDRVRKLGMQIAKGIDTIHKKEIVHRDIKPQNVLLTEEDQIKICDFSCASQLKITKNQKLQGAIGTLEYMAPQILKKYDNSVDIWSFGCTLYAMATGKVPFKLQRNQLKDYMRKVNSKNAKELRKKMLQNLLHSNRNRQQSKFKYNKKSDNMIKCGCMNHKHQQCYKKLANLLNKILIIDVNRRINMHDILRHPFFTGQPLIQSSQNEQQVQQNELNTIQYVQQSKQQQTKTRMGIIGSIQNYSRTNTQQNQNTNTNTNANHMNSVQQNQSNNGGVSTMIRPKTSYSLQNMKKHQNKYKQQNTLDKNSKKLTKTQTVLQKHKQKYNDYSQNSRIVGDKYNHNNINSNGGNKISAYQVQQYENDKKDKRRQPIKIKQQYQRRGRPEAATDSIGNDQNVNTLNTNNKENDNKNKYENRDRDRERQEHGRQYQKYAHIDQLMKYKLNDKHNHKQHTQQNTHPTHKINKYIGDGTHATPTFHNDSSATVSHKQSNAHPNHMMIQQPLNCQGLNYTIKFSQSQRVTINEQGLKGQFNHSQKSMLISPKGTHIRIMYQNKSKQYELHRLPQKYMRLYHEYKSIVDDLKQSQRKASRNSRYEEDADRQSVQPQNRQRQRQKQRALLQAQKQKQKQIQIQRTQKQKQQQARIQKQKQSELRDLTSAVGIESKSEDEQQYDDQESDEEHHEEDDQYGREQRTIQRQEQQSYELNQGGIIQNKSNSHQQERKLKHEKQFRELRELSQEDDMEAIKEKLLDIKQKHLHEDSAENSSDQHEENHDQDMSYEEVDNELREDSVSEEEMKLINNQLGRQKKLPTLSKQQENERLKHILPEDKEDIFEFIFLDLSIQLYQEPCHDNRIMESINKYVSFMKRQANKKKGVKTNLNVVKQYLKRFLGFILRAHRNILNTLDEPVGPTAIEMLRYMHENDQQPGQCEEAPSPLVIPSSVFDMFEKSLLPSIQFDVYYENDEERENKRIQFLKNILHIHNKALFDALNQYLDLLRPFGIWGKPFPWKSSSSFLHVGSDESKQESLKKASQKVVQYCSYVCGLLVDKQQSLVGNAKLSEDYLEQIKQDRLSRMLATQLMQNQQRWLFYDDEQTEVLVQISTALHIIMVKEATQQIYQVLKKKKNLAIE